MNEEQYLIAKRNYHNAHGHAESLREKQRKSMSRINHLNTELEQQKSKLQAINEKLVSATEQLRRAKEIYGPLRQEWKRLNPKTGG